MKLNKIFTVYKKEMLDMMRDTRTIITSIVLPIILYPILMIGFSSIMSRQEIKIEKEGAIIYVADKTSDKSADIIRRGLKEIDNFDIYQETENYEQLLKEDVLQAVILVEDSVSASGYPVFKIKIKYDGASDKASMAFNKIKYKLSDIKLDIIRKRLGDLQISDDILETVKVSGVNIADSKKMLGFAIGKILPYFLLMLTVSSGLVIASDLIAGEKERGTLETLLVSAADRLEIIFGKYFTVITFIVITVILNLFSMFFSFKQVIGQSGVDTSQAAIPFGSFGLIFLAMIPLIGLISALLISISAYSRTMKETNTYATPLLIGTMMLSLISSLPGIETNIGLSLIPIVNISLLFKDILTGQFNLLYYLITIGSTLILASLAIAFSVKLFYSEEVLFRSAEEKSLKIRGKNNKNIYSEHIGLIVYVIILSGMYYLASAWQLHDISKGLIKTQVLIVVLPVLLLHMIAKVKYTKTFRMNKAKPVNFILVLLISVPASFAVMGISELTNIFFPFPESYAEMFKNLLNLQNMSLWETLFLIAVLPGICEEFLFRGYFLNVFRKRGFWGSIVISALLFGILHLDIYRMIPVTLLGVWMGYVTLKTKSIFPAMTAHFANNALAVLLSLSFEKIPELTIIWDKVFFKWSVIFGAIPVFWLLLRIFNKVNREENIF
ncbi:MAG: hypothetical protein CSB55_07315 [Candidatus Cloacimonadota bacterium]|nr:MAG: hypothetical protein CSB55_07315 [Candidatus Cloacimonadota bacterium]